MAGGGALQGVKITDREDKWDLRGIAPVVEEKN